MKGITGLLSRVRQRPDKLGITGLATFKRAGQDLEVVNRLKQRRDAEKAEMAGSRA